MQQIRNIHKQNNPNYEQRFVSRGHAVYAKAYQNPMINDYTNLLILKRIDLFTGSKLPVQTMSVLIYDHFHDVCDLNQLYLENNTECANLWKMEPIRKRQINFANKQLKSDGRFRLVKNIRKTFRCISVVI
ncbi:Hypothetical_protein [Hexamita inflata]|uniref:Hypothetical_protein n=1 Tax=Hexamita inflata TaxID=28002 RepID=A0AA86RIT2_9EUKA|nr:Hypothetical protein HINF_LOCUS60564 [Hexamita inflata]